MSCKLTLFNISMSRGNAAAFSAAAFSAAALSATTFSAAALSAVALSTAPFSPATTTKHATHATHVAADPSASSSAAFAPQDSYPAFFATVTAR